MGRAPGGGRHATGRRATDPADRAAIAARQGRNRAGEAMPKGQPQAGKARSTDTDRGRVHGAGDLFAGEHPDGGNLCRLPDALADRTRVQTAEVLAPYRSNTNPYHGGRPELAISPPDPRPADR